MILTGFLIAYPFIKIDTGNTLIICNYNGDFSKFDKNHSYNELYCYDEERDISINSFDVKNFLFFYTVSMNYIEGDFRKTQFVLKESYIENFLNRKSDKPQLLYIWGHAYEIDFGCRLITLEKFEKICEMLANHNDIYYGTNSQVLFEK